MNMRGLWASAGALVLLSGPAFAQGAIQQLGPFTPGHIPVIAGNALLMDGGIATTAIGNIVGPTPTPITADGYLGTIHPSGVLADSIYGGPAATICPNCPVWDALRAVGVRPAGSTVAAINGLAGYVANHDSGYGVSLFGAGYVDANGGSMYSINTIAMDSNVNVIGTGTGRKLIGYEADFHVVNPDTIVSGIGVLGVSPVQPAYAQAIVVGSLSAQDYTLTKWTHSFVSTTGVSNEAFYAGAMAETGANVASQPITIVYRNAANTFKTYSIQANTLGGLSINGSDTNPLVGTNGNFIAKGYYDITSGAELLSEHPTSHIVSLGTGIGITEIAIGADSTVPTNMRGATNAPSATIGAPTGGNKGPSSINIQGTIWTNGVQGIASQTCTVNTASALTLIFTNGLLTGGTCNS